MTDDIKSVDAVQVNKLLGLKEIADREVRELLEKYAIYKEDVRGVVDSSYADARIVAVIDKPSIVKKVKEKIAAQKEANEKLIASAPMYFRDGAQAFRTPDLVESVVQLKVTVNDAVGSAKRTTEQLLNRYDRLIRRSERELEAEQDEFKRLQIETMIGRYKAEKETFSQTPDKVYRLRTYTHADVLALYLKWGGELVEKLRVTAGGLFIVKHTHAVDSRFTTSKANKFATSIYDDLVPLETSLGLQGLLYDEDDAARLREAKRRNRATNVEKIRPQGEDPVV